MTERQKRKKIAKLAVKIFIKHGSLDGNPSFTKCLRAAEFIENKIQDYIEAEVDDLSWARWVATDRDGSVFAYKWKPNKGDMHWWAEDEDGWRNITHKVSIDLCGRVPEWSDEEPTLIKNK